MNITYIFFFALIYFYSFLNSKELITIEDVQNAFRASEDAYRDTKIGFHVKDTKFTILHQPVIKMFHDDKVGIKAIIADDESKSTRIVCFRGTDG